MLCTLATSIASLAVFRAVQGLGAGGLFSLALAIIGDIVPPRERAKYQGYFLAVFGTSSVLGPVIGGFFAGQETILGIAGWRWVFLVNVPIAIAALIVVTRTLHLHHTPPRPPHRLLGRHHPHRRPGPAAARRRAGPRLGLGLARRRSPATPSASSASSRSSLFERSMGEEALIPLRLFQNRTVAVASVGSVFIGMGMFGGLAAMPLYLQIVKGSTPTQAGLQLLPLTLGIMSGSIVSGPAHLPHRALPPLPDHRRRAAHPRRCSLFHFVGADTPLWQTMIVDVPSSASASASTSSR